MYYRSLAVDKPVPVHNTNSFSIIALNGREWYMSKMLYVASTLYKWFISDKPGLYSFFSCYYIITKKSRLPQFLKHDHCFRCVNQDIFQGHAAIKSEDLNLRHSKLIHPLMLPPSHISVVGVAQGKDADDSHYDYLPRCVCDLYNMTRLWQHRCARQLSLLPLPMPFSSGGFKLSVHLRRSTHMVYFRRTFRTKWVCRNSPADDGLFFLWDTLITLL